MIKVVDKLEDLKGEVSQLDLGIDLEEVIRIDLPFIDSQDKFTIINIPSYGKEQTNIMILTENKVLLYSAVNSLKVDKKYDKIIKKKRGEGTVSIFLLLKSILKNYSHEFLKIRDIMNSLEVDPVLDNIEEIGKQLRKLTDRIEGLFQMIIELKEEGMESFNPEHINFEYELFTTETRYWLERCRSHTYRIASLRTKSEMRSNRELNDTMKKLTVIMTFLTIVSIVVNVPGTIGAIFGIPALSNAYFESHTPMLILTLVLTTFLSVLLGYLYWNSLNLKRP